MTIGQLTDSKAVRSALAEFDRIGRIAFLAKYGFGKARAFFLLHGGKYYDSKAIVGAAYAAQFGTLIPAAEFSGGRNTVVPLLRKLGFVVVAAQIDDELASLPEEVPDSSWEGARRSISVNLYERSAKARSDCIEVHGASCAICDFDFALEYGDDLLGYIHVHHLVPISRIGAQYRVNPQTDLLPVCPNCHAVLHHGGKTLTPVQVREMRKAAAVKRSTSAPNTMLKHPRGRQGA